MENFNYVYVLWSIDLLVKIESDFFCFIGEGSGEAKGLDVVEIKWLRSLIRDI